MDCVVTVVCEPLGDLVCEIAGPALTTLPLISTVVALLMFDCWAESDSAQASAVIRQLFTITG
jgi:hypothetical protein